MSNIDLDRKTVTKMVKQTNTETEHEATLRIYKEMLTWLAGHHGTKDCPRDKDGCRKGSCNDRDGTIERCIYSDGSGQYCIQNSVGEAVEKALRVLAKNKNL